MKSAKAVKGEKALKTVSPVGPKKHGIMFYLKKDWQLYLLLLIPLAFALIFKYGSMAGLVIAFKNYKILKGFAGSEWVGFEIFEKVFKMRDFGKSVRNTLLLNGLTLLFGFPMPIILALLLNEVKNKYFKRITQTLLYLPHFLSFVIIGAIAYQIFGQATGIVNNIIAANGGTRIPFLQQDNNWLVTYVAISVWQSMGWGTIIYLAAITGVNTELYEAATVDGAGRWAKCMNVTLPCIKGTIVTLLIMNLGKIMGGSFESVFALMNVATTKFTTTIPVLVYNYGIKSGKFSEATAIGLFQSVVGLILVLAADRVAKKLGEEGLL
ncbi:ABC transporter permease [Candidatus Galacturonibacter soehngenii]|uniref:Sugar ABC transporter permease n=1 Tax=Candidatus Galacturonatibacter soehngenii TaxID=2307010 RepID=A0A7V7QHD5_9FIRM|nr:ABC transporter permease subunit [Candidatus Galacturonibacter soehngenii]KAB1434273.1 sugar ABC transporter permease [Candidatus Galacturonibacter soehngenii]MBA4687927.1 sugar ABC transporter permease [Candidatus Galacturonibacter soehngenii]